MVQEEVPIAPEIDPSDGQGLARQRGKRCNLKTRAAEKDDTANFAAYDQVFWGHRGAWPNR